MSNRHPPLSALEYALVLSKDFLSFSIRCFYELYPQTLFENVPYIAYLASILESCRLGECRRCIINLPPRSLKSHFVSVCLPVWIMGHNPSRHIICASYGQELADDLARRRRILFRSDFFKEIFLTRLGDQQAVHNLTTTAQGSIRATSVGGALTGLGADYIILDDVQKPDDVLSVAQRRATNHWFDNTLLSRLNDPRTGVIIIVMQRLHQDDLVGHVLSV